MGLKTLVLTVDPSRRLASTLGLSQSKHELQKVDEIKGELWAGILQSQYVFDQFVLTHSVNQEQAQKLIQNRLYKQLSTTLSGSQEFTSLEWLLSHYESRKFDLIILDTPPTQHALGFFDAPSSIKNLFQDNITKWFFSPEGEKKSFFSKMFSFGTAKVFAALEILTGKEFIQNLKDFFESIRSIQAILRDRSEQAERLLHGKDSGFILVTAFDEAKFKEAIYFKLQLEQRKFELCAVVVNRMYPLLNYNESFRSQLPWIQGLQQDYAEYYQNRLKLFKELLKDLKGQTLINIPDYDEDLSRAADLKEIWKHVSFEKV